MEGGNTEVGHIDTGVCRQPSTLLRPPSHLKLLVLNKWFPVFIPAFCLILMSLNAAQVAIC